jgi:hypothetical protein
MKSIYDKKEFCDSPEMAGKHTRGLKDLYLLIYIGKWPDNMKGKNMTQRNKTRITFFDLFGGGQKVITGFPRVYSSMTKEFSMIKVIPVV